MKAEYINQKDENSVILIITESEAKEIFRFIGKTNSHDRKHICGTIYSDIVLENIYDILKDIGVTY